MMALGAMVSAYDKRNSKKPGKIVKAANHGAWTGWYISVMMFGGSRGVVSNGLFGFALVYAFESGLKRYFQKRETEKKQEAENKQE